MIKPIRVLLADDHALFRAGIRSLLQTLDGIEIVAEASNGREALDLCKMHHPDVVLDGHHHAGAQRPGRDGAAGRDLAPRHGPSSCP